MRPKVAIVRGGFLNEWETQAYAGLTMDYELCGICCYSNVFSTHGVPFEVRRVAAPADLLMVLGRRTAARMNTLIYHLLRFNYWSPWLSRCLRGFDLLHASDPLHTFSFQAAQIKRRHGIPVVLTVWENIPFVWRRHPILRYLWRRTLDGVDRFICVSEGARRALIYAGINSDRISIVHPAVDTLKFSPCAALDLSSRPLRVLFVGRLTWGKGVYTLIEAAVGVRNRISRPVELRIVGSGPRGRDVRALTKEVGVASFCTVEEGVPYHEMPSLMRWADIVVVPSLVKERWKEQFGHVLIEAMASGKALIASATGAIPEVVGEAGILVPPGEGEAIASAISRLAEDRVLLWELGVKARARAGEKFSIERFTGEMRRVYDQVLGVG